MSLPPFQALLDELGPALHRFLVAAVGHHDAHDCYQETMLSALRAYPSLEHDENLRSWLFTIAYRKVIDAARASQRRPVPVGVVPDGAGGSYESATLVDADGGVWAAVRDLPPKQRTAVVLRHAADWEYRDIAAVLDCSEVAARQNVAAGVARLREVFVR